MIAVDDKVMNSWYSLLNGVISVPVFIEGSVPEEQSSHYVELIAESEFQDDTKHNFRSDLVIITDIVTIFKTTARRDVASSIDNEIKTLVKSSPGVINLSGQNGVQILDVVSSDARFLQEYGSGITYYRKIVRYTHRIIQI